MARLLSTTAIIIAAMTAAPTIAAERGSSALVLSETSAPDIIHGGTVQVEPDTAAPSMELITAIMIDAANRMREQSLRPITTAVHVIKVEAPDFDTVLAALNDGKTTSSTDTLFNLTTVTPQDVIKRLEPFGHPLSLITTIITNKPGQKTAQDVQSNVDKLHATITSSHTGDGRLALDYDITFTSAISISNGAAMSKAKTRIAAVIAVKPGETIPSLSWDMDAATIILIRPTL